MVVLGVVGRLVLERWLQARRLLLVLVVLLKGRVDEFGRVLIVLYDDILRAERTGDETLTWVHRHNGITRLGRQQVGRGGFATGEGKRFIAVG